jgi:hypothetical protein
MSPTSVNLKGVCPFSNELLIKKASLPVDTARLEEE